METKQTLYEINQMILNCYENAVDKETGEITNIEALAEVKSLEISREEKLKSIRWIYKKMETENNLAKIEKDRINQYQKTLKNNMEKLAEYVLNNTPHETNKLIGISFRHNVEKVELNDKFIIPMEEKEEEGMFIKTTTYTPNLALIKKKLKDGEIIKGAELKIYDTVSFGKGE